MRRYLHSFRLFLWIQGRKLCARNFRNEIVDYPKRTLRFNPFKIEIWNCTNRSTVCTSFYNYWRLTITIIWHCYSKTTFVEWFYSRKIQKNLFLIIVSANLKNFWDYNTLNQRYNLWHEICIKFEIVLLQLLALSAYKNVILSKQ